MPGKQTELKIILSADSTCDLDEDLKERYNVHYFPLHINLNGKDYLDNIDITPEEIYQEYYDHKTLPKTAAVSYQNCCLAARELGHVHVVDSCNLSTGTGLTVVAAGKLLREAEEVISEPGAGRPDTGQIAAAIAEKLREGTGRRHGSFILDTLTFLSAGGRCSAVAAFGANMLKLKPCIQVDNHDGSMAVGKKYRGALDKVLVKYVKDELGKYSDIDTDLLFITHSGIPQDYIDLVRRTVEETMTFKEIHVTKASCTISCHCGPNTLGILFETKQEH